MDMRVEQVLAQVRRQQVCCAVVGASAGAIEALSYLLPALPATSSLSVLAVVHIPPNRESLLTSIFQNKCALEIMEPNDKQAIKPACIYFAPPGYHLLVENRQCLSLSVDPPVHYSRPSIDVLFESAADAFGSELMGVILTGANRDGAVGLKAIADRGGVTVVQQPCQAEAPMMPQSALDLCPTAHELSLAQMTHLFQGL